MAGTQPIDYISRVEAITEIARLVNAQTAAFHAQAQQTTDLNDQTCQLIAEFRSEVTAAGTELRTETLGYKATADEQIASLREEARVAIASLTKQSSSIEEDVSLRAAAQAAFEEKTSQFVLQMTTLEAGIRQFADESRAEVAKTRDDVSRTQSEIVRTQPGIQALIDGARSDGGSNLVRSGAQERDRPVVDPRDYKLEVLPATRSLGAWHKWKHEFEIYLNTIGPSLRGVKLVLQQARHSGFPLVPSQAGMNEVFVKATDDNGGEDPLRTGAL